MHTVDYTWQLHHPKTQIPISTLELKSDVSCVLSVSVGLDSVSMRQHKQRKDPETDAAKWSPVIVWVQAQKESFVVLYHCSDFGVLE